MPSCYNAGMVIYDSHPSVTITRQRPPSVAPSGDSAAGRAVPPAIVAGVLPPAMLHEDEIILLLVKPSLWFIVLSSLRFILITVVAAVLAVRLLPEQTNQIAVSATLVVLGRLVWALLVWTSHIYLLTNQRILTIKGVVNVTIYQAHLRKIQRTVLYKPLLERLFGLGTLGFATAATTTFDSTWIMIPRPLQTQEQIVAAVQKLQ